MSFKPGVKITIFLLFLAFVQWVYNMYDINQTQAGLEGKLAGNYSPMDFYVLRDDIIKIFETRGFKISGDDISASIEPTALGFNKMGLGNYEFKMDVKIKKRFFGIPYNTHLDYYFVLYLPARWNPDNIKEQFDSVFKPLQK